MELRHIKYFLVLAEELHFRRAAEKLFIAQPALSRQIKDLEEQLGTVLFKRDKRNVSLTLAGRYLQQEGYQLLKKVDMIKESIADLGSTMTGVINIGYIGSAMVEILPNLIHEMNERFPEVRTNLIESTTQNLLNQLMDGQIDVMIGRPHQSIEHVQSDLILRDSTVLVVASKSKREINQDFTLGDLKEVPFIIYPRSAGSDFRNQIVSRCNAHGFFPKVKHESINAFSILKLVEKDIGISVMPQSIVQQYNMRVKYLKMEDLEIPLDLVISYRTDLDQELIKTVVTLVKAQMKSVEG